MTHLSMVRQWVLAKGSNRMLQEIYLYVIEAILMLSPRWSYNEASWISGAGIDALAIVISKHPVDGNYAEVCK